MADCELLPAIGAVRTGCLCCQPKPEVAPLDWQPHLGFGLLELTCDGERPEWWDAEWPSEAVTLGEIEQCAAQDPDHDWRLRVEGPLGGVVYQRHGCAQWVAVERLDGFA